LKNRGAKKKNMLVQAETAKRYNASNWKKWVFQICLRHRKVRQCKNEEPFISIEAD